MKRITLLLSLLAVAGMATMGCTSKSQLEKTLADNPEILYKAIKANPKGFLDTVNEAVEMAKSQMATAAMDEEFKNPKSPTIEEGRAIFGKADAPITIVEYSDFQCPYCDQGYKVMKEVKQKYGDKVRIVYKHLPLVDIHPQAMPAAEYFEAIAQQGADKAEKFHDIVFEGQGELGAKKEKFLDEAAKKAGADLAKVKSVLKSKEVSARIKADMEEAQKFGFSGTPGFLVNGVAVRGAYPPDHFAMIIDRQLKDKQ